MRGVEISAKDMALLRRVHHRLAEPNKSSGDLHTTLPDGSEAKTLDQIAALTGMSRSVAAIAVLQSKAVSEELRQEAKDVSTMSGGATVTALGFRGGNRVRRNTIVQRPRVELERLKRRRKKRKKKKKEKKAMRGINPEWESSVCIMIDVSPKQVFVLPSGVKPSDLHVTLAYYGDAEEWDGPDLAKMVTILRQIASEFPVIPAKANGITRFAGDGEWGDPIVVNIDTPRLEELRAAVVQMVGKPKSEHGFTPHMSLGFIDPEDDLPMQRWPSKNIRLTGFVLSYGDETIRIPFEGAS